MQAHKSSGTYQQYAHSEAARELDLHELLDKYGESSNYKNLANQIAFTQSQSSNSSESHQMKGRLIMMHLMMTKLLVIM